MNPAEQWKLLVLEKQSYVYPGFSFTIRSYQSFRTVQKTISDQNRVCKAQGQTHKRVAIYRPSPVFPKARAIWPSPDPLHMTTSLLRLLKGVVGV
jgi:hypothetical protein